MSWQKVFDLWDELNGKNAKAQKIEEKKPKEG